MIIKYNKKFTKLEEMNYIQQKVIKTMFIKVTISTQ